MPTLSEPRAWCIRTDREAEAAAATAAAGVGGPTTATATPAVAGGATTAAGLAQRGEVALVGTVALAGCDAAVAGGTNSRRLALDRAIISCSDE